MGFLKAFILFFVLSGMCLAEIKKDIQTFSADFTQILRSFENGKENTIVYRGKIRALAPFNVLWIYTEPIPKEIYIDKYAMIVYEPKLKQAIMTQLRENMDLLSLIKNAREISENQYEAIIIGQKYDLFFQKGILQEISFVDSLENQVKITFTNIEINQKIDTNLFNFTPSSEIDIVYH